MQKTDEEPLVRYELDYVDFPKKSIPVLLERSDDEDDTEIIALIPQSGLFASGNTREEAKANLLHSMEDDYLWLKDEKNLLGQKLLSKLELLEQLFQQNDISLYIKKVHDIIYEAFKTIKSVEVDLVEDPEIPSYPKIYNSFRRTISDYQEWRQIWSSFL